MERHLIAVYDDMMFMFAEKDLENMEIDDVCVVYNDGIEDFAPELPFGCWTARMNPWEKPTEKQVERASKWLEELNGKNH